MVKINIDMNEEQNKKVELLRVLKVLRTKEEAILSMIDSYPLKINEVADNEYNTDSDPESSGFRGVSRGTLR